MDERIHVTLEFVTNNQDPQRYLSEGLMGLGAALQRVRQSNELSRYFAVPTDLPVQLEIRQLSHPAQQGAKAQPTLRVIIDAPRHHAEKMRAAIQRCSAEAIQKNLSEVLPTGVSFAALGFAADRPAKLDFVFK